MIAGFGKLLQDHKVEVTKADGSVEVYEAQHIILATGARSRSLPNVPQDGKKIIGYREALTLPQLPESMVVMGSGAIGSELAYFYSTMGTKVTIVEYVPRLVPVEDDDIAATLARCFRKAGIKTMTGAAVEKVEVVNDKCVVTVKDSKEKITEIECDIVLSAVGVATNVEGIGLEECGVQVERGKVVVDDYYRTNVEGVYAIGDCNGQGMLAHVAYRQAEVAVNHINGKDDPMRWAVVPSLVHTEPEAAFVGKTLEEAKADGIDAVGVKLSMNYSGLYLAENINGEGIMKAVFDRKKRTMIGATIVGGPASELITICSMMIDNELPVDRMKSYVFPHPTCAEIIREAIFAAKF